jgi:hypothetical protein
MKRFKMQYGSTCLIRYNYGLKKRSYYLNLLSLIYTGLKMTCVYMLGQYVFLWTRDVNAYQPIRSILLLALLHITLYNEVNLDTKP